MKHVQAQNRMLICAAFFSFGTLCGALTFLNLPLPASERIWKLFTCFITAKPLLFTPVLFCLGPLVLIAFGFSATGFPFIDFLLIISGFTAGFLIEILVRFSQHGFICSAFILIPCLCLVITGTCIRRLSFLLRAQIRYGGLLRPDYGFDALRIGSFFCILIVAALALAYFILSL